MEKLVCIAGTNASGKSSLGIELACKFGAEIVSADSRQVFKGLDLGSGKVTKEEMKGVPHHLLDVAEVNEFFSLSHFQTLAYNAIDDITARGKRAFLVGGTGLYINAVVDGYNLTQAPPDDKLRKELEEKSLEELEQIIRSYDATVLERLDVHNKRRMERAAEKLIAGVPMNLPSIRRYDTLVLGVTWNRKVLHKRIEERLDRRFEQGMIDEVRNLIDNGATDEFLYKLGLEYRFILNYLRGRYTSFEEFRAELFTAIRQLAKEQMTWFRKRKDIKWLDMEGDPAEEAAGLISAFLED